MNRLQNLSYKTLLIILFFSLAGIVFFLKIGGKTQKVSATWWDDSWHYRQAINIGNTGTLLTNFQIPINIGTSALINAGKMQSDCDDIRVTDQSGNLLTYWISGCGSTSTQIWPKIPSVPNGGATVYVYYGNISATPTKTTIGTNDYPGLSCKSILDAGNSIGNSNYWIDPTNSDTSDKFQVYCDMTNDSGGWMLVTESMINSEIGSSTTTTKTTNTNSGVDFSILNNNSSCSGSYYRVLFTDIIPWTKIKADYEFLGGNSCWSIFGNTGYNAGTNLIPFASATDTIRNQVKMGGSNGDNYDGVNSRCDNVTYNFWHTNQGVGTTRSAQVILRRNSMSSLAGLGTGTACSAAGYPWKYKNIYIREDAMTFTASSTPQSEETSTGPIAYWKFDEGVGTTAYDSAGNNNGTITGATYVSEDQCISGKCLNFSGANQYIDTTKTFSFTDLTISAWIKVAANFPVGSRVGNIIGNYSATNNINLEINTNGRLRIYWNNGQIDLNGTTNLNDGKWHNVTMVRNKTANTITLYIDNKYEAQSNAGSDISQLSKPFRIGGDYRNGNPPSAPGIPFNGLIDEVKIYPYARTADQIKLDYNSRGSLSGSSANLGVQSNTAPDLNSSLVAYWKFDENNGTVAYDSSSNKNNGNIGSGTSSPTWTNNGKYGKAIQFNDKNIAINMNNPSILNMTTNNFTISNFYYGFDTGYNGIIEKRGTGLNGYLYIVNYPNAGNLSIFLNDGGAQKTYTFTSANINANNWYHLITTINRQTNEAKLYINSKLIQTANISATTGSITSDGNFRIGYDLGGGTFNGQIDDLKIYNTALTDDQIKQDYNQGSAISFGTTNQTIGGTTTSLDYCIPGDTSFCAFPVAEYKMDEGVGTSIVDTSGNNNTGTLGAGNSSPTWTQGKIGKSLNFDGVNDFVDLNNPTSLNIDTNSFSTEGWVYFSKTIANNTFTTWISKGGYSDGLELRFVVGADGTRYIDGWIGSTAIQATYNFQPNTWYYVSVTRDSSGNVIEYINGIKVATTTTQNSLGSDNWRIGKGKVGRDFFWQGKIDHVKIYNYARTPAQIAYDYNKGSPVGWWKMDECQGNTVYDWSGPPAGGGNTGTIIIGASGTQNSLGTCAVGTSAAWTNGTTGKINSSLNFDGTDDYVNVGNNNIFNFTTGDFSIAEWIKLTTMVSATEIRRGTVNVDGYYTRIDANGLARLMINQSGTNQMTATAIGEITANKWYHIVYIRNGIKGYIYINGKDKTVTQPNLINPTSSTYNLEIGRYANADSPFPGQIDDVRIYNYALTSEQIKQVYNNGSVNFN